MIAFGLQVEGLVMRGSVGRSGSLFLHLDFEQRVPAKHPPKPIKAIVDDVRVALDAYGALVQAWKTPTFRISTSLVF